MSLLFYVVAVVFCAATCALGFAVERADFAYFIALVATQTECYVYFLLQKERLSIRFCIFLAISLRCIWLFATPNLSDDVYRFIWDGRLIAAGIHPLSHPPAYFMQPQNAITTLTPELFALLNSPHYYTVYPTVLQAIFAISNYFCSYFGSYFSVGSLAANILILKAFILAFECGTLYLLLQLLQKNKHRVLIYALNPLVINELTGNVHFEAAMIFFVLLSVFLLQKNKLNAAAFALSCAVSCKLLPLLFLPVYINVLGRQRGAAFVGRVLAFSSILLLPFLATGARAFGSSLNLYFQSFEFNGSIYYLLRAVGLWVSGYNLIAFTAPALTAIALLSIAYKYLLQKSKEKDFFTAFLWIQTVFFAAASIVHPWYIAPLVVWSCFAKQQYAVVWSLLVPLTYVAYAQTPVTENALVLWIEYGAAAAWYWYEKRWLE